MAGTVPGAALEAFVPCRLPPRLRQAPSLLVDGVQGIGSADAASPAAVLSSGQLTGPYLSAFWVRLGFPLRSKSNFRRHARPSDPGSWSRFQDFERSVAATVLAARPPGWLMPDPPGDLASRPVVVVAIAARSTVDTGNYPKSILDSLEGVLYHSDAQVAACACVGVRARVDQDAVLCFAQLPPGAPPLQCAQSLGSLLPQSLLLL